MQDTDRQTPARDNPARDNLVRLADERRTSYAALSRMLGRNSAYIQQFVTRGSPQNLDERDRRALADFFGVSETLLGKSQRDEASDAVVRVPRLGVEAAAGAGRIAAGEFAIGSYGFDERWLRAVCRAQPDALSIIKVVGDSMAPTLVDGDDVLVDGSNAGTRVRDGVYVLRRAEALMVKRLAMAPTSTTLTISSDNSAYPSWRDCPLDSVTVIGRVVWAGRKIG